MKKTFTPSQKNIVAGWHVVDANGKILGKLATDVSTLLTGKHKAIYTPNINVGDKVVVINSGKITVSKNKLKDKIYYRHTGYPGGIKSEKLEGLLKKDSTKVIRLAVKGMLPKNKLRKHRLANLYIYKGTEHPHSGQINA